MRWHDMVLLMLLSAAPAASGLSFAVSRQQALRRATAAVTTAVAITPPAIAYQGVYGMDIVKATDAVLDEEALNSAEFKAALKELKSYYSTVKSLRESVTSDGQFDIGKVISTDFDANKVRSTFNALNAVFDKDTQKGTDRLQRGIIQDLLEIDTSAKLTPGKPRSPKKLALVNEKLAKLETTLQKLDEYFANA